MPDNDTLKEKDEQPIFSLIQQIKDGTVVPEALTKDLRQQCVEALIGEGYTYSQLAQLLKRSEKTVSRDMQEIRQKNAVAPSVEFAKETVGELVTKARIHASHLMRLARSKDAKVSEKAQAEYYAHRVGIELVERLQSLGYLPSQPQAIVGEMYHHIDDKILDSISAQAIEVEKIVAESKGLSQTVQQDLSKIRAFTKKINDAQIGASKKEDNNER